MFDRTLGGRALGRGDWLTQRNEDRGKVLENS